MGGGKSPPTLKMKTNHNAENEERLHEVLREWKVDATMPPRFQEQVWRRIALAEKPDEIKTSLWQALKLWVESTFSRPALALAYIAVLMMIGLTTGYIRAEDKSAHAESQWRAEYVQSIDPYQAPRN